MSDLISRELALKTLCDLCEEREEVKELCPYKFAGCVYGALCELPTVDAEPVRHGLWIWDDEGYHCSECFYHAYGETGEVLSGNWHYCPYCGAKLATDEEKGDT